MTDPLFVVDLATLKSRLRLSGVDDDSDAVDILDEAIRDVRTRFYARLGADRVAFLLQTTETDEPTDEAGILRMLASVTELKMVRRELSCTLPWSFHDTSGGSRKQWNDEAPFREKGTRNTRELRKKLDSQIEDALDILSGSESLGNVCGIRTFDGTPDDCDKAPEIGASLRRLQPDRFPTNLSIPSEFFEL